MSQVATTALALLGASLGAAAIFMADGHRDPIEGVTWCQFDIDCAGLSSDPSAPAICMNNIPGEDPFCAVGLAAPPNADVSTALALGRRATAADLAWLQVVQFIGSSYAETVRYAGLEDWILLINTLDPRFRQPYFHGAILLSLAPGRAEVAERILLQGREAFADDTRQWEWNMWLGFVQYFGLLEPHKAADSYQRSFDAGGPKYLGAFARDLREAREGCSELWTRLNQARSEATGSGEAALVSAQASRDLLVHCFEVYLTAAAVKHKIQLHSEARTLHDLRTAGLLPDEPPDVPGMCWKIENLKVKLRSCTDDEKRAERRGE